METTDELLTVRDVALFCKVSVGVVYKAIIKRRLKASNLGTKALRILKSDMWNWINERKQ